MASTAKTRPIAPLDLAAEREFLGAELEEAILRVLRSGAYVLGPEVERLERSFAELCRVPHAIGVSSGTDALVLGLRALGLQPGQEVLTSAFTFFASAGSIAWAGGVPRLVDVDPATGLIDVEAAARAIDASTAGILPVHLYGQLCDMRALRRLADEHGLFLLEDGAQAHGATREGYACGELGDAAAFSFYPTKNLGALGEAGMVVTRDAEVAGRLRALRDHGSKQKYVHDSLGTNARMDAFQGAALNVKLPHLEEWNRRRQEWAARYDAAFAASESVEPLRREPRTSHAFHQYAVRVRAEAGERDALLAGLKERGILAAVHYPRPVHEQPAAAAWLRAGERFPGAEQLAREVLCLPVHPFLTAEQVDRVAATLIELCGG